MSSITLLNASCADQTVDAVANAANDGLWAGGGICGVIFKKAGLATLTAACKQYKTPLKDGSAVITPAFQMTKCQEHHPCGGTKYTVTIFQQQKRPQLRRAIGIRRKGDILRQSNLPQRKFEGKRFYNLLLLSIKLTSTI